MFVKRRNNKKLNTSYLAFWIELYLNIIWVYGFKDLLKRGNGFHQELLIKDVSFFFSSVFSFQPLEPALDYDIRYGTLSKKKRTKAQACQKNKPATNV